MSNARAVGSVMPPTHANLSHPRRAPANRSVSLLHSARRKPSPNDRSDSSSDSAARNQAPRTSTEQPQDSPSSLQPLGRGSSGESSNAERWFEQSNNAVRDNSASFADNDPPFFMRNSSSSSTPPDVAQQLKQYLNARDASASLPLRTGLLQLGTDGGSSEEFRGVIDDLTIENKKLKRRLKRYEKLHDSHLKDEKLFEVRIHGLPAEKKRELEETLRKFAAGLGSRGGAEFPQNGYSDLMPLLQSKKTAGSHASLQHTDSAYASMSASGLGSSAQSGNDSRHSRVATSSTSARQQTTQNIQSYLHQIPEGLLPQQNPSAMTERSKKKLVVRRLEQIFAGKGANSAGHQHQLQQQEVSQMAARADRSAMEAQGQRARQEGNREALIMAKESDDAKNESPDGLATGFHLPAKVGEQDFAEPSHDQQPLDQRPTRPLDLDPQRAQVPAENIRYMRHLGFSPPYTETGSDYEEGHGWIYLNFLHNLAQLHTINVTTDFVRKALGEYSDHFEISHDGRKVRWKGGHKTTRTSSSAGWSPHDRTSDDTQDGQSPRKRPKLSHKSSPRSNRQGLQTGAGAGAIQRSQSEKFVYTPLFFHKDGTDESDDSSSEDDDDATSSPFPVPIAGDSSGMTSSGIRTTSTKKKQNKDDGPIIFYNNARFCTDLSGEREPQGNPNAPPYLKISAHPIGKPPPPVQTPVEKRGPLAEAVELPEPMDLGDNPIPESMELSFPPNSPLDSEAGSDAKPVKLEVTGIGGVWPADNFAIQVESRHARADQEAAPAITKDFVPASLPPRFAEILHGADAKGKKRAAVHKQVLSSNLKALPPSELPPALSFMPFDDDSSYEDDSDADDDVVSMSPDDPAAFPPSAAPQLIEIPSVDSDEGDSEEDDDDSDCESDSSLDLLAAAREVDPEAIREQEREYDANMAERLAEEIPAGSSAATAGGGSGFASPASGVDDEEFRRAQIEARAARHAGLKRSTTSDSMAVQGLEESSEDDSDDEAMSDVRS